MTIDAPEPHELRHVFLAVPTHDSRIWMKTVSSVIGALHSSMARVRYAPIGGSAICTNFNALLAQCLNHNAKGQNRYTHFAMLHSDVAAFPPDEFRSWLDGLICEIETYQLAAVSAAVRIKTDRREVAGETSTAIDRRGEVMRLTPEMIGETLLSEAVPGGVLLINTGCLLLDLRHPAWEGFSFDFGDALAIDGDELVAVNDPEDWRMSRWLANKGARYAATTKVKTLHFGGAEWST